MLKASRTEALKAVLTGVPAFRSKQIEEALFQPYDGWAEVKNLPKGLRERLIAEVPWMTVQESQLLQSKRGDTFKVALEVEGDKKIETVLMANARGQWTVCVSSQVGCAMRCGFCATGKMGLTRNLTSDEIVDQYRYWTAFLRKHPDLQPRISNIVFMGMGEPLANYEEVKRACRTILQYTDIGETHIVVSTVGVLPRLKQILTDKEFPPVRIALSLHSAIAATRKAIVPTSYDNFLPTVVEWTKQYFAAFPARRRHLTFEYVMLKGVNDDDAHADALALYANEAGRVRVNLIPYNFTGGEFSRSLDERIGAFVKKLEYAGVTVTVRRTMGDDIAAACGQLITDPKKAPTGGKPEYADEN